MYVTRPMSLLRKHPDLLSVRPNEGPNSGYLVLFDEEQPTTNCLCLKTIDTRIKELPFPQNHNLIILDQEVLFIPVLDEPLSSNRYYAISSSIFDEGLAFASSRKGKDVVTCCNGTYTLDVPPRPFNALDIYQQFNVIRNKNGDFSVMSVASDGIPPTLLKYCRRMDTSHRGYQLGHASGLDIHLRTRLPRFKFSVSEERSKAVVIGKWYCPSIFVEEGDLSPKQRKLLSTFYEVTLEQRWEKIFGFENWVHYGKVVEIDVVVEREEGFVKARRVVWEEQRYRNGESWFRGNYLDESTWVHEKGGCFRECHDCGASKRDDRLELSGLIMERLKWEQKRGGWVDGVDKKVRIMRREVFRGSNGRTKFGCYVLVERFVFKRMDDSIALVYDFKHTHQIRCNWE